MTADRGPVLALDTATTRAVVALGDADGRLLDAEAWPAGWRHGEELLARLEALLARAGVVPAGLAGLVAGTGPGAFTGLRVGLATVKGLARALGLPVVGVPTGAALLRAAADAGVADPRVLLLPAGPSDLVRWAAGEPGAILRAGEAPGGDDVVAVDLAGRAPAAAVARGELAHAGLGAALLALGAPRLAAGAADDLAHLVPEYVTLPRGVREAPAGGVEVSGARPRP